MATHARPVVSPNFVPQVGRKRIRAVVADDARDMQQVTAWILERDGLAEVVGTANNGALAVELTEALAPDLVVLDVNMPRMSGFEAAVLIKQAWPETKVLIISSDDDPELGLCALDCGADGFLWKGDLASRCRGRLEIMFGN